MTNDTTAGGLDLSTSEENLGIIEISSEGKANSSKSGVPMDSWASFPTYKGSSWTSSELNDSVSVAAEESFANEIVQLSENTPTKVFHRKTDVQRRPKTASFEPRKPPNFSHRHFLPFHPTCSKLLALRWESSARQLHLQKIDSARSAIDNSPPKSYPHLELRLRRLQNDEDCRASIQHSNRILLDRIAYQMTNAKVKLSALDSDNKGLPEIPAHLSNPKRQHDLENIAIENLTILQRLEDKPPNYSREKALSDRQKNLEYLFNIAMYPSTYRRILKEMGDDPLKRADDWSSRLSTAANSRQQSLRHGSVERSNSIRNSTFERSTSTFRASRTQTTRASAKSGVVNDPSSEAAKAENKGELVQSFPRSVSGDLNGRPRTARSRSRPGSTHTSSSNVAQERKSARSSAPSSARSTKISSKNDDVGFQDGCIISGGIGVARTVEVASAYGLPLPQAVLSSGRKGVGSSSSSRSMRPPLSASVASC
ncbi:hypothetical protein BJ742DRAFT_855578 [Cladochytrium replicatum]|nr:hypothetical protein BJ742DRAFT_855578 [Cladochytrium replicatum]